MGCSSSSDNYVNPNEIDLTHFELLKVVGKGGFGKVNAVQFIQTNELMALKRIEKYSVLQSNNHLRMIWIERKIMSAVRDSNFLVNLNYAFQNDTELFLVMPFMQGGDLRYFLRENHYMNELQCQYYAAQILLGLEALHKKKIIFRDLKPDNMLLDSDGNLRISDFGLACILKKEFNYMTTGQAGTRGYQAPEVITDQYYGCSADVWSYGITLYELLHGVRPFKDWSKVTHLIDEDIDSNNNVIRNNKLSHNEDDNNEYDTSIRLHISSRLSPACHSLLRGLLRADVSRRLGCGISGWSEIKSHPFFNGLDWNALINRQLTPPIKPDITRANCTADADLADQLLDRKPRNIQPEQQKLFEQWNFRTEIVKQNISNDNINNNNNSQSTINEQSPLTNNNGRESSLSGSRHVKLIATESYQQQINQQ